MTNHFFFHRHPSPIGPLLLLSDGAALVGLYTAGHDEAGGPIDAWSRAARSRVAPSDAVEDRSPFREVGEQLDRYFAGELTRFDVPLRLDGTPFQRAVWSELVTIPWGTTRFYGELAARLGNPRAVRAVGAANGRNPVSIIVPCHRVIGASGDLVGYGGGLDCKRWLLAHERALDPLLSRNEGYGSSAVFATAVAK